MKKKWKRRRIGWQKKKWNMTYILHGGMEGLKIEMKCGLVFRPGKERDSRFLKWDLGLIEIEPQ